MSSESKFGLSKFVPSNQCCTSFWRQEDSSFKQSIFRKVKEAANNRETDSDCKSPSHQIFKRGICLIEQQNPQNLKNLIDSNRTTGQGNNKEKVFVQFNTFNLLSDNNCYSFLLNSTWLISLISVFCILLCVLFFILLILTRRRKCRKIKSKSLVKDKNSFLKDSNCSRNDEKAKSQLLGNVEDTPVKDMKNKLTKDFKSDEFVVKKVNYQFTPVNSKRNSILPASAKVRKISFHQSRCEDVSPLSFNHFRYEIGRKLSDNFIEKLTKDIDNLTSNTCDVLSTISISYENDKFENSFSSIVEIGSHPYGKIFKALHKLEGVYYTIKRIDINVRENEDLRKNCMFKEVSTMVNLHHKNVVRLITSWVEEHPSEECDLIGLTRIRAQSEFKPTGSDSGSSNEEASDFEIIFEEETYNKSRSVKSHEMRPFNKWNKVSLYIQMEYCSGTSLSNYILGNECKLTNSDIFFVFNEIIEGLSYIHSKGLIHRNLTPDNIFITSKGDIKIGEFGVATVIKDNYDKNIIKDILKSDSSTNLIRTFEKYSKSNDSKLLMSNSIYKAPEIQSNSRYDNKADIYSAGIILFELLSRFKTFHEKVRQTEMLKKTHRVSKKLRDEYTIQSTIIEAMVSINVNKRPTAGEIKDLDSFVFWETISKVNCK